MADPNIDKSNPSLIMFLSSLERQPTRITFFRLNTYTLVWQTCWEFLKAFATKRFCCAESLLCEGSFKGCICYLNTVQFYSTDTNDYVRSRQTSREHCIQTPCTSGTRTVKHLPVWFKLWVSMLCLLITWIRSQAIKEWMRRIHKQVQMILASLFFNDLYFTKNHGFFVNGSRSFSKKVERVLTPCLPNAWRTGRQHTKWCGEDQWSFFKIKLNYF